MAKKTSTKDSKAQAPKAATTKTAVKKAAAKPAPEKDIFGFVAGSKTSEAVAHLASGNFTMKQIKEKFGSTFYNALKQLAARGGTVEKTEAGTYKIEAPAK